LLDATEGHAQSTDSTAARRIDAGLAAEAQQRSGRADTIIDYELDVASLDELLEHPEECFGLKIRRPRLLEEIELNDLAHLIDAEVAPDFESRVAVIVTVARKREALE
jgi:hypothetical protein